MIRLVKAGLFETVTKADRGKPNGVVPLNEHGMIDTQYLPCYVEEVVDLYIDPETGKGYMDHEHTQEYTDYIGSTIYNDLDGTGSYRWTGERLSPIPDTTSMVEITAETVREMWDSIDKTGLTTMELLTKLEESLTD